MECKRKKKEEKDRHWKHAGGKMIALGPNKLTDAELLAIIIGTGIKGKSAEQIAEEIIKKFSSFRGMACQPAEKFLQINGLGKVKFLRIVAVFEIARRIVQMVQKDLENEEK